MEGTRQEYIILISDNFPIDQGMLQGELQALLMAQDDEDYEGFFNPSFSLVVSRVHECMSKTTISNAAARMHDESAFDVTTWSKRGPGWYRDRWLGIIVDKIVAEWSQEEDGTPEDNELMALHKKITALEKELKEKSEEVKKLENTQDKSKEKERADRLQRKLDESYDANVVLQESLDMTEAALKEKAADLESLQYLLKEYEVEQEEKDMKAQVTSAPKNGSYTKKLEMALEILDFDNVLERIKGAEGISEK